MASKIAVSAGHNPKAQGAEFQGVTEYAVTTKYMNSLAKYLGAAAVIIPTGPLTQKISAINKSGASIALEVHFNAGGTVGKATGTETLYCPGSKRGAALAEKVNNAIVSAVPGIKNRGIKEAWYQMDRPGVVDYKGDVDGDEKVDAFVGNTKPVSLIIEPFFIWELEAMENYREAICKAIADVLLAA